MEIKKKVDHKLTNIFYEIKMFKKVIKITKIGQIISSYKFIKMFLFISKH